jgi:hypothetical protein
LAEQEQGDEGSGVHLVVEQETQLVEQLGRQQMSLIDDQEHIAALAGQVLEGAPELGQEAHEAEGRFDLKGEEDFAVESGDAEMRVGQIDDGVDVAVQVSAATLFDRQGFLIKIRRAVAWPRTRWGNR